MHSNVCRWKEFHVHAIWTGDVFVQPGKMSRIYVPTYLLPGRPGRVLVETSKTRSTIWLFESNRKRGRNPPANSYKGLLSYSINNWSKSHTYRSIAAENITPQDLRTARDLLTTKGWQINAEIGADLVVPATDREDPAPAWPTEAGSTSLQVWR